MEAVASPPPVWSMEPTGDGSRIVVTFTGHLSASEGRQSAQRFVQLMGSKNVAAVFDVREMAGYDSGARAAWQSVLWPHRQQLESITLVGGSKLVNMGGVVLGMALGVKVKSRPDLPPV